MRLKVSNWRLVINCDLLIDQVGHSAPISRYVIEFANVILVNKIDPPIETYLSLLVTIVLTSEHSMVFLTFSDVSRCSKRRGIVYKPDNSRSMALVDKETAGQVKDFISKVSIVSLFCINFVVVL